MSSSLCSSKISPARKDCVCDVSIEAEEEEALRRTYSEIRRMTPRFMPSSVPSPPYNDCIWNLPVPEEDNRIGNHGSTLVSGRAKLLSWRKSLLRPIVKPGKETSSGLLEPISTSVRHQREFDQMPYLEAPPIHQDRSLNGILVKLDSPSNESILDFDEKPEPQDELSDHPDQIPCNSSESSIVAREAEPIPPQQHMVEQNMRQQDSPPSNIVQKRARKKPDLPPLDIHSNQRCSQRGIQQLPSSSNLLVAEERTRFDNIDQLREYVQNAISPSPARSSDGAPPPILNREGKYSVEHSSQDAGRSETCKSHVKLSKRVTFNREVFIWSVPKRKHKA